MSAFLVISCIVFTHDTRIYTKSGYFNITSICLLQSIFSQGGCLQLSDCVMIRASLNHATSHLPPKSIAKTVRFWFGLRAELRGLGYMFN